MDDDGIGVVAIVLILVGVIVVGIAATGIGMYASDAAISATVQEDCNPTEGLVPVKNKTFGISHTVQDISPQQCALIEEGQFVKYHIKSQRTIVYQSEGGDCIWDTSKTPGFPC